MDKEMSKTPRQRFDEAWMPITESGCWIWSSLTDDSSYGRLRIDGNQISAHRFSYSEFVGEIPEGLCVCHKCDIPSCVNPDHLFLGTHQENIDDRVRKGRSHRGKVRGEANYNSKLTEQDVISIRLDASNGVPRSVLQNKYKISQSGIRLIIIKETWSHI